MCRRHIQQGFVSIPRLSEEEARGQRRASSGVVVVVDVLCQNLACFYRDETRWEEVARRRAQPFGLCGSSACLTRNRCCLVVDEPTSFSHKKRRYVLDELSVC